MKKLRANLAVKIIAVIISYFTVFASVIGVVGIGMMIFNDFYTSNYNTLLTNKMEEFSNREIYNAASHYYYHGDMESYYKDKNVYAQIFDESGKKIFDNYNGEKYISRVEDKIDFYYDDGYDEDLEAMLDVVIIIPKDMKFTDRFALLKKAIDVGYKLRYSGIFITILSLAASIVLICYLHIAAGWKRGEDKPLLSLLDRVPIDIYLLFLFVIGMAEIFFLDEIYNFNPQIIFSAVFISIDYFIVLGFTMSLAVRIKTKTLFKNSIIYKLGVIFIRLIKYILKNINVFWKTVLLLGIVFIYDMITISSFLYDEDMMYICWICKFIVLSLLLVFAAYSFNEIKKGSEKIANGDLNSKIDTKYMYFDFKDLSENLNNINEGLQAAVSQRMKSEHFKTELITNVSHDIKTPVTSIINYVDLIKKENITEEPLKGYIEVLDRQSLRLKKLTEDIVEASKASTGNITVNLSKCEVGVLLSQTIGEFSERLEENNIIPVVNLPQNDIKILADGRLLWRVFDNLMSNVCKYAQQGTRLYLTAEVIGKKVVISFKNISRYPLNVTGEELMERFVRGDASRNTEGSGLGLSIAKSLIELQNGSFEIIVDGDLFKTVITFYEISGETNA